MSNKRNFVLQGKELCAVLHSLKQLCHIHDPRVYNLFITFQKALDCDLNDILTDEDFKWHKVIKHRILNFHEETVEVDYNTSKWPIYEKNLSNVKIKTRFNTFKNRLKADHDRELANWESLPLIPINKWDTDIQFSVSNNDRKIFEYDFSVDKGYMYYLPLNNSFQSEENDDVKFVSKFKDQKICKPVYESLNNIKSASSKKNVRFKIPSQSGFLEVNKELDDLETSLKDLRGIFDSELSIEEGSKTKTIGDKVDWSVNNKSEKFENLKDDLNLIDFSKINSLPNPSKEVSSDNNLLMPNKKPLTSISSTVDIKKICPNIIIKKFDNKQIILLKKLLFTDKRSKRQIMNEYLQMFSMSPKQTKDYHWSVSENNEFSSMIMISITGEHNPKCYKSSYTTSKSLSRDEIANLFMEDVKLFFNNLKD